ncbi:hypothetical protein BRADI_2g27085v3 [Brachypodium distachyon]|uniref:Cysteine-rich transmembrane domain-containing protein n=1 Tax=Brachypodium distachyon TaxID=15368 RepID=A0A0Q3G5F1_BRADI|nr:hypothetical protein BRADI_2g27085v3 [Brachypodium distachyon]
MEGNRKEHLQPPPGYPTEDSVAGAGGDGSPRGGRTRQRGRKTSFLDACVAALCCCWLCDLCCA